MSGVESNAPRGMGRGRGRGRAKEMPAATPEPAPMPAYTMKMEEVAGGSAYRPGGFGREVKGNPENVYGTDELRDMYKPTPYPETMPRGEHSSEAPIKPRFKLQQEETKTGLRWDDPACLKEKPVATADPDFFWSAPAAAEPAAPAAAAPPAASSEQLELQKQLAAMTQRMELMEKKTREAEEQKEREREAALAEVRRENEELKERLKREEEERMLDRRAEEAEQARQVEEEAERARQAKEERRMADMQRREEERRREEEKKENQRREQEKREQQKREAEEKKQKEREQREEERKKAEAKRQAEEEKKNAAQTKKTPAKGVWDLDDIEEDEAPRESRTIVIASKPAAKQAKKQQQKQPTADNSDSDEVDFASLHSGLQQKKQPAKKQKEKAPAPAPKAGKAAKGQSIKDIQKQQQKESAAENRQKETERKAEETAKAAAAPVTNAWGATAWGKTPAVKKQKTLKQIQEEEMKKAGIVPQQQEATKKRKKKKNKVDHSAVDDEEEDKEQEQEQEQEQFPVSMGPVIDADLLRWTEQKLRSFITAKAGVDIEAAAVIFCSSSSKDDLRTNVSDVLGLRKGASQFAEDFILKKWPAAQLKAAMLKGAAQKAEQPKKSQGKNRSRKNNAGNTLLNFGVTAGSSFNVGNTRGGGKASKMEELPNNNSFSEAPDNCNSITIGAVHYDRSSLLEQTSNHVMRLNGKEFPIHRPLLAPVSLYFQQVLSSEWMESKRRIISVDIDGVTPAEFEWVLKNTYGEESKALNKNQIEGTLKIASYFQLEPLIHRIQEVVRKVILTASELIDLQITHSGVLDSVADVIQIEDEDVERLLSVATSVGATKMERRCGTALAEKLLVKDADVDEVAKLPISALLGCFSSDNMSGLPNEDALFDLIYALCAAQDYPHDVELEFAACVRLQFLSVHGIEKASKWEAIDRNSIIAALAKQRDPNAFSEVARENSRRFYVAFSSDLSKGSLAFHDSCTTVTHVSKVRAVAVVDTPCERGKVVKVTFVLSNDKKGDEGTCFGVVSRLEVGPVDYREAVGPLWRAYNGEIRENRAVRTEIEKLHPKDIATLQIDGILKKVEFIKDGKSLATRDCIPDSAWPLCPAVWFYGNNEKVVVQNTACR